MNETSTSATMTDFTGESSQYLTFTLQNEEYALDILKVQEIKGFSKITPIPNTPHYIRGVMNLRGTVVPIVDLRARFAMTETEYDKFAVIIVVNVGRKIVGLVVDTVSDVLDIKSSDVDETPELGAGVDTSFITGMAKVDEKLVMLLDIDRVVGGHELETLETSAA